MECRAHFIRDCNICSGQTNLQKNKYIFPKIVAYGPSVYTMNHPAFIVYSCREIPLEINGLKHGLCLRLKTKQMHDIHSSISSINVCF